jgi:hypothetical protein
MSKVRTTIYLDEKKADELKIKAIKSGVSLSEYLSTAGTITSIAKIKEAVDSDIKYTAQAAGTPART